MILARAPLRITLGGGGTDLPSYYSKHGGFALTAAIDKYVYICVNRPPADSLIRVKYSRYEEVESLDEIVHDLVRPTLEQLGIRDTIEIVSLADVPAGTGLGSSSTYLVALLIGLHELKRERVSSQALAEEAFHIERELAGHPVGKQDHYAAAFGGVTCIQIAPDGMVQVSPLNLSVSATETLLARVLLFSTGIRRKADDILHEQRRGSERGDPNMIESLHRTKELGLEVREALQKGDVDAFGSILHEHWQTKKRRSESMSDGRVDAWYDRARAAGASGGKIVGAGGGGFLMLYCPDGSKDSVRQAMVSEGLRELTYSIDYDGAKVLVNF